MRSIAVIAIAVLPLGMANGAEPRHDHPYVRHWKTATFGKAAVARVGVNAGINQVRHQPKGWVGGIAGFGERVGAGFATHAVKTTVEHAIAAPLHEDLHYHRSTEHGVGPRLRHALVSTVITQNTRNGKRTPAVGRLSGEAAAGAFSQAALHAAGGASTAGIGLGAEAGANVAREFWPRRQHRELVRRPARKRSG